MSRLLLRCALIALATLIVAPGVAHAWTPGTHVFLGEAVIRSLAALPPAIGALLSEFPFDFLYGSIAADTSIAKKYAPVGRHCHSWNVGFEKINRSGEPAGGGSSSDRRVGARPKGFFCTP